MTSPTPDIIQIGDEGKRWFQIGKDGQPFEIDVVHTEGEWSAIDRTFRNDAFELPPDRWQEYNIAQWQFVCKLSGRQDLNMTQVLGFMKQLHLQGEKLRRFFEIDTPDAPSSPESTTLLFGT